MQMKKIHQHSLFFYPKALYAISTEVSCFSISPTFRMGKGHSQGVGDWRELKLLVTHEILHSVLQRALQEPHHLLILDLHSLLIWGFN
jgi:hypothetical protein